MARALGSGRVIDLHSHILPGVDDGPADLQGSLALARAAVEGGTETIAATPHIDHLFSVDPAEVREAVARLGAELDAAGIPLRVVAGGELNVTRIPELTDEDLRALRLGDGPYLLVEAPLTYSPGSLEQAVYEVRLQGHQVLLAHPERSAALQREPDRLVQLVEAGALCSITAGSMRGQFGDTVRRFTLWMLAEGLVHDVASDTHDHRRRTPDLLAGFQDADRDLPGLAEQAGWYTRDAPAAILDGQALPPRPDPPKRRRGLLGRLRGG